MIVVLNCNFLTRFNISQTSIETADYLHDISNIFLSKLLRQCGDRCNVARSEKQVSVRLLAQTNETEITWNTDESYRLDVITSGKLIYYFIQLSDFIFFGSLSTRFKYMNGCL